MLYCPDCRTTFEDDSSAFFAHVTDGPCSCTTLRCPVRGCYGTVIDLDENMIPIIDKLYKELDVITLFCCSGHYVDGYSSGYISMLYNECNPFLVKLKEIAQGDNCEIEKKDKEFGNRTEFKNIVDQESGLSIEYMKYPYNFRKVRGIDGDVYDVDSEIVLRLPHKSLPRKRWYPNCGVDFMGFHRVILEGIISVMDFIDEVEDEVYNRDEDDPNITTPGSVITEEKLREYHKIVDETEMLPNILDIASKVIAKKTDEDCRCHFELDTDEPDPISKDENDRTETTIQNELEAFKKFIDELNSRNFTLATVHDEKKDLVEKLRSIYGSFECNRGNPSDFLTRSELIGKIYDILKDENISQAPHDRLMNIAKNIIMLAFGDRYQPVTKGVSDAEKKNFVVTRLDNLKDLLNEIRSREIPPHGTVLIVPPIIQKKPIIEEDLQNVIKYFDCNADNESDIDRRYTIMTIIWSLLEDVNLNFNPLDNILTIAEKITGLFGFGDQTSYFKKVDITSEDADHMLFIDATKLNLEKLVKRSENIDNTLVEDFVLPFEKKWLQTLIDVFASAAGDSVSDIYNIAKIVSETYYDIYPQLSAAYDNTRNKNFSERKTIKLLYFKLCRELHEPICKLISKSNERKVKYIDRVADNLADMLTFINPLDQEIDPGEYIKWLQEKIHYLLNFISASIPTRFELAAKIEITMADIIVCTFINGISPMLDRDNMCRNFVIQLYRRLEQK